MIISSELLRTLKNIPQSLYWDCFTFIKNWGRMKRRFETHLEVTGLKFQIEKFQLPSWACSGPQRLQKNWKFFYLQLTRNYRFESFLCWNDLLFISPLQPAVVHFNHNISILKYHSRDNNSVILRKFYTIMVPINLETTYGRDNERPW